VSTEEHWFPSHVRELSEAECLEVLAAHEVGRVAYCDDLGPVVLPVNYVLDEDTVLFQISPHSVLAHHLRGGAASFQIDDFDSYTQSGWSVLVRGEASYVDSGDLPEGSHRPFAWAEGGRTLHVRIIPRAITGRRLVPA
jgi:hypothetical protein